ncbi:MAG TPA: hybrid sensor histidine kinase/response regulator [Thermoanaerobaculia bacterium]|nr:hybrid sensor histidine kinase/response regulator [Thermoanaerobaculia bacterium]
MPDDLGTAKLDRVRLHQIVWNLLNNAVKFTSAGGAVTLVARRRMDEELEIVVQDEGEGVDPEFLPYIFDPFRQAKMGVNRTHGGLGLGLTIVRHLVTAHDGSIVAESEGLGKGATFRVSIPIVAAAPSAESEPATKHDRHLEGRLDGCHILVVDDDANSRRFISSLLQKAGASADVADSVASALSFLDKNRPDLIVTDIAMPELGGEELLRRLRE